jgi:hypothetical protein
MKLVVRVAESAAPAPTVWVNLDEFHLDYADAGMLYQLADPPPDVLEAFTVEAPDGTAVRALGSTLFDSLAAHPAIRQAVDAVLASQEDCPIYLRLHSPLASNYPWESLFSTQHDSFLALESRWPIARITEFNPSEKDVHYFAAPLRVLAVLSAVGVDASEEWRGLYARVLEERERAGLDVRVRVVAGQRELKEEIEALGDPAVSVVLLENKARIMREISGFDPHVLHFFCHGRGAPVPFLELGTPTDHITGEPGIFIEPNELRIGGLDTWLVVLNCCRGGSADSGVRSLGHQLVNAGYPAVVAMREPIDFRDANLFTSAFYDAMLSRLSEDLVAGRPVRLEWASALHGPRQALRDKHGGPPSAAAASHRDWTFPVLYVSPEPLRVQRIMVHADHDVATRDRLLGQLRGYSKAHEQLDAQTPQEAIDEVASRLRDVIVQLASPPARHGS